MWNYIVEFCGEEYADEWYEDRLQDKEYFMLPMDYLKALETKYHQDAGKLKIVYEVKTAQDRSWELRLEELKWMP